MFLQDEAIQVEIYIQKTKNYIQVQTTESDSLMCLMEFLILHDSQLQIPRRMIFYINSIEVDPYIEFGRLKKNIGLNQEKLKVNIAQIQQILQADKKDSKQHRNALRKASFSFKDDSEDQSSDQFGYSNNNKGGLHQSLIGYDDDQLKIAVNINKIKQKVQKVQKEQRLQKQQKGQKVQKLQKVQKVQNYFQNKRQQNQEQFSQDKDSKNQPSRFTIRILFKDLHDMRQIIVNNCEETKTLNSILRKRQEEIANFEQRQFIYIINNVSIGKDQLCKQLKYLPNEWKINKDKNQEIRIKMTVRYNGG